MQNWVLVVMSCSSVSIIRKNKLWTVANINLSLSVKGFAFTIYEVFSSQILCGFYFGVIDLISPVLSNSSYSISEFKHIAIILQYFIYNKVFSNSSYSIANLNNLLFSTFQSWQRCIICTFCVCYVELLWSNEVLIVSG